MIEWGVLHWRSTLAQSSAAKRDDKGGGSWNGKLQSVACSSNE